MPFDGTKLDETTKLLIEGRAKVERGWIQGAYCTVDGVCMTGALGYGGDGVFDIELDILDAATKRLEAATGWCPVTLWNDVPGRTQAEVIAAYDRAIAGESA